MKCVANSHFVFSAFLWLLSTRPSCFPAALSYIDHNLASCTQKKKQAGEIFEDAFAVRKMTWVQLLVKSQHNTSLFKHSSLFVIKFEREVNGLIEMNITSIWIYFFSLTRDTNLCQCIDVLLSDLENSHNGCNILKCSVDISTCRWNISPTIILLTDK